MWSRISRDRRGHGVAGAPAAASDAASNAVVDVLMYHSISAAPGPTSLPPETFLMQLEVLATSGCEVVSLGAFIDWHAGAAGLPARAVVITFDDGFADFAERAFPALQGRAWPATVFLPTGKLGGVEDWQGANRAPRRLLDWAQVRELGRQGIEFGAHSVSHADLTRLSAAQLEHELRDSRDAIGQHLGAPPISFAPPYGRSSPRVRDELRRWYRVAVGTRLERAGRGCDPYDVPRVEMHYFRDRARWRRHLERRDRWYFASRRALRRVKAVAMHAWRG